MYWLLESVKAKPPATVEAFMWAVAQYHFWECAGLPDDPECLRRVCSVDTHDWERVRGVIFDDDRFFRLEGGLWHLRLDRK